MEKEGQKGEPPSGPLETQGRHKNAFGGDWLTVTNSTKNLKITTVSLFTNKMLEKRNEIILKLTLWPLFHLKSMTFETVMQILFVPDN